MVIGAGEPCVQGRQQNHADYKVSDEPPDNDNRKRPLRIRSDAVRERCRQQTQGRNQHGHGDGPKSQNCAFHRRLLNVVTASPKLIDIFNHDDPDLHRYPEERQEADARRHTEVRVRNQERQQSADRRHGDVGQDQQRPFHRLEHRVQDDVDEKDRQRQYKQQAPLRALRAFVFASPIDGVADRQLDRGIDLLHCFFDGTAQISTTHAELDGNVSRIRLTIDFRSAIHHIYFRELRQRNPLTRGSEQTDLLNGFLRVSIGRQVTEYQIVSLFPQQHLAESVTSHRGLNCILDVGDIDRVARSLIAVHGEVEVGLADNPKHSQVLHALNILHDGDDLVRLGFERFQVVSINLDCQFALDTAHRFFHVVRNRLREVPGDSGNFFQLAAHRRDQPLFVLTEDRAPLCLGQQINEVFGIEKACGVSAIIWTSYLRHHPRNFWKRSQDYARRVHYRQAFSRSRAGRQGSAYPDGALIQVRQELGTNRTAESQKHRQQKCNHCRPNGQRAMPNGPVEGGPVVVGQKLHHRVLPLLGALVEQQGGQSRCYQHRKHQGAKQGESHGPRHGLEQLSFHLLQRKNRKIRRNYDRNRVKHRSLHFVGSFANPLHQRTRCFIGAVEMSHDVLHHDHRAIDDHAEVECT